MSSIQKPSAGKRGSSINSPKSPAPSSQSKIPGGKRSSQKRGEKDAPEVLDSEVNTPAPTEEVLNISIPPPSTSTAHRDLRKCPCQQSKNAWLMDCSRCKQFWHVDCLGLQGLSQSGYNKLTEYLCPFCFVAPVATTMPDSGSCYICRNTLSLQQSNSQHEVAIATTKLKAMESFSQAVEKFDFESLTQQMGTVQDLDLHLKHLLLDTTSLEQQQERVKKVDDSVIDLKDQISHLQGQVTELISRPHPEQQCASKLSEEFMTSITSRLDEICQEQPQIREGIEGLKASVGSLEQRIHAPAIPEEQTTAQENSLGNSSDEEQSSHGQEPLLSHEEDFIDTTMERELTELFEEQQSEFESEGGHSVLYFGEKYKYTGSSSSNRDRPIPQTIKALMDQINSSVCTGDCPKVNSCLVNKFEGTESYLPKHSDNEPTIHPESNIVTLSLGSECVLKFSDCVDGGVVKEHPAKPRSIYSMTRKSQEFFEHRIDLGSVCEGVRYSLTFRSVSWKNRNATCILGDSNTAGLKFGCDPKRSFGSSFPGRQFPTPLVADINPYNTCGYSNVVLMSAINNLKSENIKNPSHVRGIYNLFVKKIEKIQIINPRAHIFVCPVLPTKRADLNRKGICFNMMLINELLPSNFGVSIVDGFDQFLDETGLLARALSRDYNRNRRPDFLHLNWKGLAKLGILIRNTVLRRKSGGIGQRRTGVDGTSYRDVAAANRAPEHDGYQPSS